MGGVLDEAAPSLERLRSRWDGYASHSSQAQADVESEVISLYQLYKGEQAIQSREATPLAVDRHIDYALGGLKPMPAFFKIFDASRPWLIYWNLHSIHLMKGAVPETIYHRAVATIASFQVPSGGFGGGPGQLAHLAPTYSSICALAEVGTTEAYNVIDRDGLYKFLMSVKQKDGSFTMDKGGEVDLRGSYCAIMVAAMTNILTPELVENVAEFISRCQTYQGGIGAEPYAEAHGALAYCGLATLYTICQPKEIFRRLDVPSLTRWAVELQCTLEGGFRGRDNKLVDVCYGFWVAGLFPLLAALYRHHDSDGKEGNADILFDREALQEYILICAQNETGGLRDKIGKPSDAYHTSQALSGLSTSQHALHCLPRPPTSPITRWTALDPPPSTFAHPLLSPTHPLVNVTLERAERMMVYFYRG